VLIYFTFNWQALEEALVRQQELISALEKKKKKKKFFVF